MELHLSLIIVLALCLTMINWSLRDILKQLIRMNQIKEDNTTTNTPDQSSTTTNPFERGESSMGMRRERPR